MIDDLDATLEALLKRELPALVSPVTITFAAPDNDFPPSSVALPAIDVFLYDVRENRELRLGDWQIEREANGNFTRQRPPARVDCSYLITAWTGSGGPNQGRDEHRLLSEAMQVLLRFPTLPPEVLQGTLQTQDVPLPTSTLQPGRLQSIAEFWQALGGRAKAVLHYTATIGVSPSGPLQLGPPVSDVVVTVSEGVPR